MDDIKNLINDEVRKLEEEGITDWTTIKSTIKDTLIILLICFASSVFFGYIASVIEWFAF